MISILKFCLQGSKEQALVVWSAVCCTLIPFATSVIESSSQSLPDVSNFENGYACKSCYREVEKLQKLQKQLGELKESFLTKVTKSAHLFPVTSRRSASSSTGNAIQTPTCVVHHPERELLQNQPVVVNTGSEGGSSNLLCLHPALLSNIHQLSL